MPSVRDLFDLDMRFDQYSEFDERDYVCEAAQFDGGSEWCNNVATYECDHTLSHDGRYLCYACHEALRLLGLSTAKLIPRVRRIPK